MNPAPIDSVRSPFRSIGRMAGLCDTANCANCDCPAVVALALSTRIEKPEELRLLEQLPEDIVALIGETRNRVASEICGAETCLITDHYLPTFLPRKLTQSGPDSEL